MRRNEFFLLLCYHTKSSRDDFIIERLLIEQTFHHMTHAHALPNCMIRCEFSVAVSSSRIAGRTPQHSEYSFQ